VPIGLHLNGVENNQSAKVPAIMSKDMQMRKRLRPLVVGILGRIDRIVGVCSITIPPFV
jgi:hypothetical protein